MKPSTVLSKWALCALFLSALAATPVAAQEQAQEASTVIYDSAYFEQFSPVSLEDMIRNIPGGVTVLSALNRQGNARGFGSTDAPILINGRRMSGKANDMSTTLARTQASQVERIELIRGTAVGLDIRSEGIIYNVVLRAGADKSSSNFLEFGLNIVGEAPVTPDVLVSHNGRRGALEYSISYQYDTRPAVAKVDEDILAPDGTPQQFRALVNQKREFKHKFTGNIGYEFENGARIQLNALYSDNVKREAKLEDQFIVGPGGARTPFAVEDGRFRFANQEFEIGGDVELEVGGIGRLKTLFVVNRTNNQDAISQDLIAGGMTNRFFSNIADFDEGETILRSTMTSRFGGHTLEYGAEGAFNRLDKTFSFNGDPLENAIVKEDRYEVFVTDSLSLTKKLDLQTAITGEFSTIFQNREGEANSRSFEFLKPRVELRYDLTPADQFRLVAERKVSQLDLNDFVASRNVADDLISFGNSNLVPESNWLFTLGFEKRFSDDRGSLKVEMFYDRISDHIDKILIGTASSGVGNIGSARRWGFETEISTRFGFIGLPTAVLTIRYDYQNTQTTDPFTDERRQMRNKTPHFINIDFRHDVENSKFAYGFSGHRRSGNRRQDVSLREVTDYHRHIFAFVEYNFSATVKFRFDARHILRDTRSFNKTFFVGNIADDVVERIDFQIDEANPDFLLNLQATF